MSTRRLRRLVLALTAVAAIVVPATVLAWDGLAPGKATLGKHLRVGVDNDGRRWDLGGFSALYPLLDAPGHSFVTVTDRVPNDDITCGGVAGKVIFVPAFAPRLVYFSVQDGAIKIDRVKPMRVGNQLASGIANIAGDENSFTSSCKPIPTDPYGVDTEGIALDPGAKVPGRKGQGIFWLADEYRPSILNSTAGGHLLSRIVPKGSTGDAYEAAVASADADSGDSLDVHKQFPAIVGSKFRKNRGFEDVAAIAFKGRKYVYTALQSPMENPDTTTRNSLAIRVFRIDVTKKDSPVVDREWAALLDVNPAKKSPLSDKVSALWPAGPDKLLIEERDDTVSSDPAASTKIYTVDFSKATNLLGGAYDDPATSPTLEQKYIPAANGVVPADPADVTLAKKTLCVDVNAALTANGLVNTKIEGISLVKAGGKTTLALVDDNDFDLAHVTNPGANPTANPTTVDFVPLPAGCS